LLPFARAAAAEAGVTRLADLTGLDRIGFPVWQAVRPLSRALSVHQGKGSRTADAQIGALLEAVESHCAEGFEAEGPVCRWDALPPTERAPLLADFGVTGQAPLLADHPVRWVEARDLLTDRRLHLPFLTASLDFTWGDQLPFDRASNGVATGARREEALATALHEFVERDAVVEWAARGLLACTASTLEHDSVPHDWFHHWLERLRSLAIWPRFYAIPTLTRSPLFACVLEDLSRDALAYRGNAGHGCHPDPEVALFKALAEAIQARATYLAGAREDLLHAYRAAPAGTLLVRYGLPPPDGMRGVRWSDLSDGPVGSQALAVALAAAGYPQVATLDLAEPERLHVVRVFVPGLGSESRRRRPPS